MRDLSSGNINILDPEEIIDIVFGHPMVKLLMTFFQILSAISGAVFLFKLYKKAKPCVTQTVDANLKGFYSIFVSVGPNYGSENLFFWPFLG